MHVEATRASPLATDADTIVVGVFEGEGIVHDVPGETLAGLLSSGEASGSFKRLAVAHAQERRFIVVGLGSRDRFDTEAARVAAAIAHARASELRTRTLCWEVPHNLDDPVVGGLVQGTLLHAYRFERYKRAEDDVAVERLLLSAHHDVSAVVERARILASAQNRARDLGNSPPNDLSPVQLAEYASELADRHRQLHATVLSERQIVELGMGAFASVASGSDQEARLIRLDLQGDDSKHKPLVGLVGKAVTFDSGGLSLKPAASMPEMKFDMSGGAAVLECVSALAELAAPVRVMAVVGATENLPSGGAVRPGDIVRALNALTIEVDNTDAEGRLVLADCLTYAAREGCETLIDIATLTGGIVAALGSVHAGLMGIDDELLEVVEDCGRQTGELVWRLPLHPSYAEMMKGRYAELRNVAERREAMSIVAAEFLRRFTGGRRWAHLDIAGTAWDVRREYYADKGATGFGVRLLAEVAMALAGEAADSDLR